MTVFQRRDDILRGYGNEERPVTKILWDRDSHNPNSAMEEVGNHDPHRLNGDFKRYYDPEYAKAEHEKIWMKSWIFACREEDIPNVGDRVPLRVGQTSFIIIRSAANAFNAFFNSCLHRGTELCSKAEGGDVIKCPYHSWEWKINGDLRRIPSHWDFESMTLKSGGLPQVRLERWGGFIYINADPEAPTLLETLGPVPEHFAGFGYENRYTAAHFRKSVRANWKVAQEAFMESYHVIGTHPEAIPYNGDSQTQYDIFAGKYYNIGRQVTPSAVPSMHAPADATPLMAAQVYAATMKAWHYPDMEMPDLDPNKNLRVQIAEWHRQAQKQFYDVDQSAVPDAVMLDSTLYFIFPQSTMWLSESLPFTYQFLPHPTDVERSYFSVRMMLPVKEGAPRPPSAPIIEVGDDETVADKAPSFGILGVIFDQDMKNMPLIQMGMHAADPARPHSTLGTYQEQIIQHWLDISDEKMAR